MSQTAARAADVEKMKMQMMQVWEPHKFSGIRHQEDRILNKIKLRINHVHRRWTSRTQRSCSEWRENIARTWLLSSPYLPTTGEPWFLRTPKFLSFYFQACHRWALISKKSYPSTFRLATQISRSITKNRDAFDAMSATDKVVQVKLTQNFNLLLILLFQLMKAVMEDEEIVEGFKMAMDNVSFTA